MRRAILHVFLPLAIGAVAYIAWRETEVRLVTWIPHGAIVALRASAGRIPMPRAIAGSLPDGAWAWAFGAAMSLVWRGTQRRSALPWLAAGGALALGVELGQGVGVIPGTFDAIDLVAIAPGYACGAFLAAHRKTKSSATQPSA